MEHSEHKSILAFDTLYTSNHIQILKILLPFLGDAQQKWMAVLIKFLELQYTLELIKLPGSAFPCDFSNRVNNSSPDIVEIFEQIKNFCTPDERALFDQIARLKSTFDQYEQMMQMMELFQQMMPSEDSRDKTSENSFGDFSSLLGNLSAGSNPMDMLQGMLSDEQRSMFEMFQSAMNEKN